MTKISASNSIWKNLNELKNDSFTLTLSKINLLEKPLEFIQIILHDLNEMNSLDLGDIIFFNRGVYEHSAIFSNLETFEVIHKNSKHDSAYLFQSLLSGSYENMDKSGEVRVNYILDVIHESKIRKNNFFDEQCPPLYVKFSFFYKGRFVGLAYSFFSPKNEIIERAFENLGAEDYDVLNSNCQHFVFLKRNNINRAPGV